ncbi:hypothetical protein SAVCW2_07340 [Streptomyces avermitilis]|nr:hypothetical protein SAVCW2_07340 [Streptomyces avermitilis]
MTPSGIGTGAGVRSGGCQPSAGVQRRTTRAGAPATTAWSGTTPRTTAPAATTTFRPIRAPGRITAPVPIQQPDPIDTGSIRGHCLPMGS